MPKHRRTRTQWRDPHESPAAKPGTDKSARRARQVCRARFDFRNTKAIRSSRRRLRQGPLRWVGNARWTREHQTASVACNPAR